MAEIQNANPVVYEVRQRWILNANENDDDNDYDNYKNNHENDREEITPEEVYEYIRNLNDPEHPLTLEQLNVVNIEHIHVNDKENTVLVQFTPTIPHCSMATLIGLCIRVKLLRSLPSRFKITVQIYPGSHQSEVAVNKQLNDKERVAAAIENGHLLDVVNKCITKTDKF